MPKQSREKVRADYSPATTIFQTFQRPQHLAYELFGFLGAGVRKNPNLGALFLSIDRFNPPYRLLIADLAQVALSGRLVSILHLLITLVVTDP